MATREQEWEELLGIKTSGRDDSHSDGEHHPYEPTDYCVLERLANSGLIRKKNTLIDYGSGKEGEYFPGLPDGLPFSRHRIRRTALAESNAQRQEPGGTTARLLRPGRCGGL